MLNVSNAQFTSHLKHDVLIKTKSEFIKASVFNDQRLGLELRFYIERFLRQTLNQKAIHLLAFAVARCFVSALV